MKTIFAFGFLLVAVFAADVASYPALGDDALGEFAEDSQDTAAALHEAVEDHGIRMKRATCDLLSFQSKWVTPNHSACAAHCLALLKGFKGGRCVDGVCHCRK